MANLNKDIIRSIREQLQAYSSEMVLQEVGYVLEVGDAIAKVYGLSEVMYGELVSLPKGIFGLVLNLEEDSIGCILFGDYHLIKEGDEVRRTGRVMKVPVGEKLLGRVVNPLGEPLDCKGNIETSTFRPI